MDEKIASQGDPVHSTAARPSNEGRNEDTAAIANAAVNNTQRQEECKIDPDITNEAPYTVHSKGKKIGIVITASFMAVVSPLSSSIYWPVLPALSRDMHVSMSVMNLTITSYLILQGLAPSVMGTFSDTYGRRPVYLTCFTLYLAANIGLALQDNFAALLVLRCLQASGSSATVALGSAVAADIVTRAERGKFIGYAGMGVTLGPSLGPVIGGFLGGYLGWRWIFWFLTILSGVLVAVVLVVFPETCRAVVGNGSIAPPPWNKTLCQIGSERWKRRNGQHAEDNARYDTIQASKRRPNPVTSLRIISEKGSALVLLYGGLVFCGYIVVMSTLPSELENRFGFGAIQVGLCYLPLGLGSLTSRWTGGFLTDWNFRREARRQNLQIVSNRQQDIRNFNIEVARLAITFPLVYGAGLCIIAYGWVMEYRTTLAGPLVMLFFTGHFTTAAFSTLTILIVDTHRESAATAAAANNLLRCLMGAASSAFAIPLINRIGIGWTATFIAGVWVAFSPFIWVVYFRGHKWREEARLKAEEHRDDGRV